MSEGAESGSEHLKPLPVVLTNRNWNAGRGAVHREEKPHRCSKSPVRRSAAYTDLHTAAVCENVWLCPNCEWPDGAEEFIPRKTRTGDGR